MSSLRIAVIVAGTPVPAWVATLVERLPTPAFEVGVYVDGAKPEEVVPWSYRAYQWIDARVFRGAHDALAPAFLPGFDPRPLAALGEADVVVQLASADARELADVTRYGAWSLSHPELFWEMHECTTYRTTLEAQLPGGECRLLYESRGRPDRTSLHRSRNEAYWKATGAIVRALRHLDERGQAYLDSRPRLRDTRSPRKPPRSTTVVRHAATASFGVLARRLGKLVRREEWFVAARPLGTADGFRRLEITPEEGLADPFAVEHDGQTYVFFERLDHRAGHASIACTRIDDSGRAAEPVITVLAPGYHLSYPFVFVGG